MKKLLALTLALVLALSLLAGCTGSTSSSTTTTSSEATSESTSTADDPTQISAEITWWAFPTFAQDDGAAAGTYERELIKAFNEKYPNIKVNLETIDFTSGPEAITAAIEGGTAPDVLFDAPGRIIEYGKNGALVSLDDLFTADFIADVGNEELINACKGDGVAYMYPLSTAPFYMVINEAMWSDSGALEYVNLDGERKWTTDDLEKALNLLKNDGYNPGTLFCNGQGGDQGTRAFISNLYGAEIANAAMTEYTMNSPAGIKGLETAQKWIDEGILGNGVAYNGSGDIELFVSGTTSFTLCWGASTAKSNAATLADNGIETISLPFPSDDGTPALEYLVNGFCIFDNKDANKVAASKEFIKFICDDATWGPKDVVQTGAFPVRSSFGNLYPGDEEMELLASWTQYYAPYYNTMDGFANMRTQWWNMLQEITNGADVTTAVDKYVEESNAGM
jgi:multiple sugar transport system substrate-binding protein